MSYIIGCHIPFLRSSAQQHYAWLLLYTKSVCTRLHAYPEMQYISVARDSRRIRKSEFATEFARAKRRGPRTPGPRGRHESRELLPNWDAPRGRAIKLLLYLAASSPQQFPYFLGNPRVAVSRVRSSREQPSKQRGRTRSF